jgi:hypothetical protein
MLWSPTYCREEKGARSFPSPTDAPDRARVCEGEAYSRRGGDDDRLASCREGSVMVAGDDDGESQEQD